MVVRINGKEVISSPVMAGTWTAAGTVALPAFTCGGTVTLGGQTLAAAGIQALITHTLSNQGLQIDGSNGTHGSRLKLNHAHTTPDQGNIAGSFVVSGYDGNATPAIFNWGQMIWSYENVGDGTEEGLLTFYLPAAGTQDNVAMTLSGAGVLSVDVGFDADEYYQVASTQVVSAQGAAVANPTDAASTQARLIDLLGRLRTHGLIAT